jgi:hypothetical protein
VVQHPAKLNIFYSGKTNSLERYDRNTGLVTDIQPYPRIVMGEAAEDMPERWNWNYPIVVSDLEPDAIYIGSQHLWKSTDEGENWKKISPDLTRADPETMKDSGGPIIPDQDGPEIYATIYSIEPSPHDPNTLWLGSDDGLVHLTRNGGQEWIDVTPVDLPVNSKVSSIEASPHNPATAYITAKRYEMGDRAPYIWKTVDYGKTWSKIINGIREDDFCHSIFGDPVKKGLLFLGSEHGVWVSFDDGNNWQSLSNGLPDTPVMGIAVKQNDLVMATHGRSFWKMENIEVLRQIAGINISAKNYYLFKPHKAIRRAVPAIIDFYVSKDGEKINIEIVNEEGEAVRQLLDKKVENNGMFRLEWDLRYEGAVSFPGIILEGGNPSRGPWAPPGKYMVKMTAGDQNLKQEFELEKDPRLTDVTVEDLYEQYELALKIRDCESAANEMVVVYRKIKSELENRLKRSSDKKLHKEAPVFLENLSEIVKEIYQLKNQSPKDKIAYPIKLNDRLTGLRSHLETGDMKPTKGYYDVFEELSSELEIYRDAFSSLLSKKLPGINESLVRLNLERIKL